MSNFEAIILAGGLGTRLRSLMKQRQKVSAEVAGKPFFHYLIQQLYSQNIKKITLCLGYAAETVKDFLPELPEDLKLHFSVEKEALGTAGAVRLAVNENSTAELLILNGDSYIDADFNTLQKWKHVKDAPAAIVLCEVDDVSRYGQVQLNENAQITAFCEKGFAIGKGLINAGAYLLNKELLLNLPVNQKLSFETDFFPKLVKDKLLYGKSCKTKFIDIGTPESYKEAQKFFN